MPLKRVETKRVFKYDNMVLDDPDPKMTPEQVKEFYAEIYPELTQAGIEGPEQASDGATVEYEFDKAVGTKGISVEEIAKGKHFRGMTGPVMTEQDFMDIAEVAAIIGKDRGRSDNEEAEAILPPSEALEMI